MGSKKLRFVQRDEASYPDWTEHSIEEVYDVSRGTVIPKPSLSEFKTTTHLFPVYSSQSLDKGVMGWTDTPKLEGEKIMWTTDGANAGTVFFREGKYSSTNVCGMLTAKPNYEGYANFCMATALGQVAKKYVSYVGNPKLMSNIVASIKINFPSLPEQEKIAEFLSALDERIELQERKIELLTQQKKGYVQRIFSRELRFHDDNGNEYPEWEEKTLGELVYIVGGGTPSTSEPSFWGGNINWFSPAEIKNKFSSVSMRKLTKEGLEKSSAKILMPGTVLLTTRATLGRMSILTEEASTNQGFQSLVPKVGTTNSEFIYQLQPQIKKYCYAKASGSTFKEISKLVLSKMPIFVPPIGEQEKIANFLSVLDDQINLEKEKLDQLKLQKQGYMQRIFGE